MADQQQKLELLITARDQANKAVADLNKQIAGIGGSAKGSTKEMEKFARLKEPLMQMASGPLQGIFGQFGAILNLAKSIPLLLAGPIAIVIGIVVALEAKFKVLSKTVGTVKEVFTALANFDFSNLGQAISDVWSGAKEKAEAAIKATNDYNTALARTLEAEGKKGDAARIAAKAAYDAEDARLQKEVANVSERVRLSDLNVRTYRATIHAISQAEVDENNKRVDNTSEAENKKLEIVQDAENKKQQAIETAHYAELDFKNKLAADVEKEKQKEIDDYNKNLEERQKRNVQRLKNEESAEAQSSVIKRQIWLEDNQAQIQLGAGAFQAIQGAMAQSMVAIVAGQGTFAEKMKAIWKNLFVNIMALIAQMLAKMAILFVIKSLITGGIGSATGILGTIFGGLGGKAADIGLPSFQTHFGDSKRVPGPMNSPVPIMAHGGEIIGRQNNGGGGATIMFNGDVYNFDEAVEKMRSALFKHQRITGLGIA